MGSETVSVTVRADQSEDRTGEFDTSLLRLHTPDCVQVVLPFFEALAHATRIETNCLLNDCVLKSQNNERFTFLVRRQIRIRNFSPRVRFSEEHLDKTLQVIKVNKKKINGQSPVS